MKDIWNEIVDKTRAFVHGTGFARVAIGVSGGIDSAEVACIAVAAFGADNVLGVMLPSVISSPGSITDSQALAANWGFKVIEVPIDPRVTAFGLSLEPVFRHTMKTITRENIQARTRAVMLMAICNEQDRLLLNTCNRSEDYVGYCTLYGDTCGAVAPIGGLYKTEVYALARWINMNPDLPNIPTAIIDKEPSAELSEGQLDTDTLPPYDVLDTILQLHLDDGAPLEVYDDLGYDRALVERVIKMVEGSAYKRAQSPPVIEVTRSRR